MRLRFLLVLLSLVISTSCSYASGEELIVISSNQIKKATYEIEIADTDIKRAHGLMGRTDITENQGMLFVFKDEQIRTFWMKDTPLSLDILFINSDGYIVSIAEDAVPNSTKRITSFFPARYALEILGGQSKNKDIHVGDKIITETISDQAK